MQNDKSLVKTGKPFAAFLLWFYTRLLRFYPAIFRASFEDEMIDVFSITLQESAGQLGLALTFWREVRSLPMNLLTAHYQAYKQLPQNMRRVRQIHWFVRLIVGLALFLFSTLRLLLSPSYNLYAQAVPFVVTLFIASISMLLSLLWGRVGGLLTITSAAAVGCMMTLYLYVKAVDSIGIIATVLIGLIWALPFLIFGLLFYDFANHSRQPITSA